MRIAFAGLALAAAACSVDPGQDRAGTVAAGIAVDSVRFLPIGSRFVLRGSETGVAFLRYHAGYVCSRFLAAGLSEGAEGEPPAYRAALRVRLPASDECALDSGRYDTSVTRIFREDGLVRLANAAGKVTDSAPAVVGRLDSVSIRGVPDSNKAFTSGKLTYRDSSARGRTLSADSVPECTWLNSAEWSKGTGDTVEVRLTWVTVDPAADPEECEDAPHFDERAVLPRRALSLRPAKP
jgi:hypothetical protein